MDTKTLMTALSGGRILVGLALTVAPSAAGRLWFGRTAAQPPTSVAIRALGIRDLALGVATIGTLRATGTEGMGFKVLAGLGIACDAVDAAATIQARNELPNKGMGAAVVASGAAAVGAIVLSGRD